MLKAQLENDLKEVEKNIIKWNKEYQNTNSFFTYTEIDCFRNEEFKKKQLIVKYLKFLENEIVVEVGKEYRIKNGNYIFLGDNNHNILSDDDKYVEHIITEIKKLENNNGIIYFKRSDLEVSEQYGEMSLQLFKFIFEEIDKI